MTLYLLDANTISNMMANQDPASQRASERFEAGDGLGLCRPIHYEIWRGLRWRGAKTKFRIYTEIVMPLLTWIELDETDWENAAELWATARRQGKQLADTDLLLGALSRRTGAVIVSSDTDFDAIPVQREDWRI